MTSIYKYNTISFNKLTPNHLWVLNLCGFHGLTKGMGANLLTLSTELCIGLY